MMKKTSAALSFLACLVSLTSVAPAADVVAPGSGKTFTLTVKNFGSSELTGVGVRIASEDDPAGVLTVHGVAPEAATIEAGQSKDFEAGFDVICPSAPRSFETVKLRFALTSASNGPVYVKNCGVDPAGCAELEAEITVDTSSCTRLGISVAGVEAGRNYSSGVSATITVSDDAPVLATFAGSFGDGGTDDVTRAYDAPLATDSATHAYHKKCSANSYTLSASATDQAGATAQLSLQFSIDGAQCPQCFSCEDSERGGAVCRQAPGARDCLPPIWFVRGPDDNVDLATNPPVEITSLDSYDGSSPIGVLRNGYYTEMFKLLASFGAKAALVGTGFDPSIHEQIRVLVIPSGGLGGLDNSWLFRSALAEYANRGGTIVSLSQAYGDELAALPGAPGGYGWVQDTACFSKAFYIERYHQFLSGQHIVEGTSDAEVDGYFTDLPLGAQVYLRRTRNGQPGLIEYPYGFAGGRVIATTSYGDWAFANGQASLDSRHLLRDIIAWAFDPKELPEYRPENASPARPLQVMHAGDAVPGGDAPATAELVRFSVLTPDRRPYLELIVPAHVAPGTLVEAELPTFALPAESTETVGIWWVDYTLLDAAGSEVQDPVRWHRFVVSPTDVSPYQASDFYFSIQTDSDAYPVGGRAEFTFLAFNNTDRDRTVTVRPDLWASESILVPAFGRNQIVRVLNPVRWINSNWIGGGRVSAGFHGEGGALLGTISKNFSVYIPAVELGVIIPRGEYGRGETVPIELRMLNKSPANQHNDYAFKLLDPAGLVLLERSYSFDSGPDSQRIVTLDHNLAADAPEGTYRATLEAFDDRGNKVASALRTFLLPRALIAVRPIWPAVFSTSSVVAFEVRNVGTGAVTATQLAARLRAPDGLVVWSGGANTGGLAPAAAETVSVSVVVPTIVLGSYAFEYELSYDGKTAAGREILGSSLGVALSLESAEVKLNTALGLRVTLANDGRFLQTVTVGTSVPDIGFQSSRALVVEPGSSETLDLRPDVVGIVPVGAHSVLVEAVLASGEHVTASQEFRVIEPAVAIDVALESPSGPRDTFRIRDTLVPRIRLTASESFAGALDATCRIEIPAAAHAESAPVTLQPGATVVMPAVVDSFPRPLSLPESLPAGRHEVRVSLDFANGYTETRVASFTVADSKLVLSSPGADYAAGDVIVVEVENVGGVDADYTTEYLELYDEDWNTIAAASPAGRILVGERRVLTELAIPDTVAAGYAYLYASVTDGHPQSYLLSKRVRISGASASLSVATGQEVYTRAEPVSGSAEVVVTSSSGIEDTSLTLRVEHFNDGQGKEFRRVVPRNRYFNFGEPQGIAFALDGSVYIASSWQNRVQKFDASGRLLTQWGTQGTGPGEFDWPMGIAVGPDGTVYVIDQWNSRIQKFDPNGHHISSWGTYGQGDGQFNYPESLAVGPDGMVYVADTYNKRVQKFDASGNFVLKWPVAGISGNPEGASGIAADLNGFIYVAGASGIHKYDDSGTLLGTFGSYFHGELLTIDASGYVYSAYWCDSLIEKYDSNGNHLDTLEVALWEGGRNACVYAIAASADDKLYVADTWYRVQQIGLDGTLLDAWKSYGSEDGHFGYGSPSDVGTNGWGFYALDRDNDRVQYFTDDGELAFQWGGNGGTSGMFAGPNSLLVSPNWQVYVADTGNNRIQVFSWDGGFVHSWGGNGTGVGQFRSPTGIARAPDGTIYVVDSSNNRVQRFTAYGYFLGMWGSYGTGNGQFFYPSRVAVDANGIVYVTDTYNHRVQKFDKYGTFLGKWGTYGTGDGQFDLPIGIAVTPEGNILVVDSCSTNRNDRAKNNRVMEFDNQGNFIRSWGAGLGDPRSWDARGSVGDANGMFNRPEGVAVGPDGSIYVADTGNRRVQRLSRTAGYETVFQSVTPLTQAGGTTATHPFNVGILDLTGQMNVAATLSNSLGQEIASAQHPFFIVDSEVSIAFSTDKGIYRPGEAVLVTAEARNRTDQAVDGVLVTITQGATTIYSELIDLPAGGSYAFGASLAAAEEGSFLLSGSAERAGTVISEASVGYEVVTPALHASLYGPDVAGADPFALELYLSNNCRLPLTVTYFSAALGASGEVTLEPWQGTSLFFEPTITGNTEFVVEIAGDVPQTVTKTVAYGLAAEVQVATAQFYPEGRVDVPYTVTNAGVLPGSYPVDFELFDTAGNSIATSRFVHNLTVGDATAAEGGSVGLNLAAGEYRLRHATIGSAGDTMIRVTRPEARVALGAAATYPEGLVAIPHVLENVGHLPGSFAVTTRVTSGAQVVHERTSSIFLNSPDENPAAPGYVGTTHATTLVLTLAPGSYRVQAGGAGVAGAAADFVVLPKVAPEINVSAGVSAAGRLPVTVSVLNNGTEPFSGLILAETGFWSGEASIDASPPDVAAHRQFDVPLAGLPSGPHAFTARLLDEGGNLLKEETATFEVRGPELRVSRLPGYATFAAGGIAQEEVCVANDGDQEGFLVLALAAFEGAERIPASLEVDQERCFQFEFPVPDDIEEKDYDARYSLFRLAGGVETLVDEGRIPFHVASVKVDVVASLDRKLYRPGESARLTLDIASTGTLADRALFARVRFGDHEEYRSFTLATAGTRLEFDVPVLTFEDRLLFEVLMGTGRSIYINTLFVQERHDAVRVFTDRPSYLPGDAVVVTVETDVAGVVELSALGGAFTQSLVLEALTPAVTSFILPADIYGGTQAITCAFGAETHGYRFNVASPRVEFLNARLDKSRYGDGEPFLARFEVLAGAEMDGWVDGYIEDPEGALAPAFSYHGRFAAGVTEFEVTGFIVAPRTGLHKLYSLFYGNAARSRALTSAAEFLDVGAFALTQVIADKARYREGIDPVVLTAYLAGEVFGWLSLAVDGQTLFTEPVSSAGFNQFALTIPAAVISGPGVHVARVRLWSGGEESIRDVAFEVRKRPEPPAFSPLPALTNLTAIDVSGFADPAARIDLLVNGAPAGSVTAGTDGAFALPNVPLAIEGQNLLDAVAYDYEGTASTHTTATVERDTVAPTVAILSPQPGFVATPTPVLEFSVSDGVVAVTVDEVPTAIASGQPLGPFADGEHRCEVAATDLAGNAGYASVTFTVQTAVPTEVVIAIAGAAGRQIGGVPVYAFTASGAYTGRRVVTAADGRAVFPISDFAAGSYRFRADFLGYQFWSADLPIPAVAQAVVQIPEEPATVTVLQAGSPRSGVRVYLYTASGTYLSLSELTGASGAVSFTVPAGKAYKFRADYLGTAYYGPAVTIAAGGPNAYVVDVGGGTLSLTVEQNPGQPLAGAATYLFSDSGSYLNVTKVTDAAGRAEYPVSSGSYRVRCDYLGYQFWSDTVAVNGDMSLGLPVPHHTTTVTVSGSYAGSVEPKANVPVYLFSAAGAYLNRMVRTGADGRASFSLPERGYKARVDYLSASYWTGPLAAADVPLTIAEGVAAVTVAASAGALANVPVYVYNKNGTYLNLTKKTGAEGTTSFRLPAETYKFRADHLGSQFFSAPAALLADQVNPITIATGGGAFTLTLQSDDGRPLSGVSCYLFNAAGSYLNVSRTSGAQGQASFDLANGSYKFRVDHRGYQFWTDPVTVPGAGSLTFRIPEEEVTVSVLRGGGPQAGVPVYLFTSSGSHLNVSAATDVAGAALFELPAGKGYKLRADFLGSQYWSDPFTVLAGGPNLVTIDMGGGTLTVAVDRGDGTPLAGAKTYLFSAAGSYLGLSGTTDVAGRFGFAVSRGTYKVRCDHLGYQFWSAAATVAQDAEAPLSIPHRDVTVTVAGDFGGDVEARPDLPVYLFTTAGSYLNVSRRTDAGGNAVFSLPERDYKVRVDHISYRYWSDPIRGSSAAVVIPEALAEVTVVRGLEPLPGAPVYLFNAAGQYQNVSTVTDAGGIAWFRVPAETFLFRADNLGNQFFSTPVELAAHVVNPVSISLGGGNFALRLGDGGTPLPGVPCYLFDEAGAYLNASRVTDAMGTASFDLANGSYRFRADFLGHQFWTDVVIVPNVMETQLDVPLAEVPVSVQGVYGVDVRALASVPVYLFNEGGSYLGQRRETDESGAASFTLPQRAYRVRADVLGGQYWTEPFTGTPQVIGIAEGMAEVEVLQAGAPLAGVLVYVFGETGSYLGLSERTDGAGKALFRLPAGPYRFAADVQGSRFVGSGVVAAGAVNPIALATGGGRFDLTVGSSDGRVLGGVPVYVFTPQHSYIGVQGRTDAAGTAGFTLSEGEYLFRADTAGYQFWSPPHAVPTEASAVFTIPYGIAAVHVTSAGADVPGARVYLFSPDGRYLERSLVTDGAGIAEFSVPAESFTFRVDHQGGQFWSAVTVVDENAVTGVDVEVVP